MTIGSKMKTTLDIQDHEARIVSGVRHAKRLPPWTNGLTLTDLQQVQVALRNGGYSPEGIVGAEFTAP